MSRTIRDAVVQSSIVPSFQEKWTDLPFDKLHPFSKTVRLVIDSASHLADILDKNDEEEIAHELSLGSSCFLRNLKILLKIEYRPARNLISIMPELKEQLLRLKASFTRRYEWGKSRFVAGEIDRLIKEICDNPRFDNIYLQKDIYVYFCNIFQALNSNPLAQPTHGEDLVKTPCNQNALETINANIEHADSLPSQNATMLEELNSRDVVAEKIQDVGKGKPKYEYVRIRGKEVKVVGPESHSRFAENVRVMICSTANLFEALIMNDTREIDRNLRPNASPFLTDLRALLKTACLPNVNAPKDMPKLRTYLQRLKIAFVKHFGAAKSNDAVNGIAKLVDAVCDHPQYGNKAVFKELFECFCKNFKAMKVSKPCESKLQAALKSLKVIVEDACANSKDGAFLFTREDYVAVVNELWKNQNSSGYAVKQSEAATIAELWLKIRTKLIKYAKSMIPKPAEPISGLSHRDCWQLYPKFTTVNEEPHVLDSTTLKELYVTLNIPETPRKTIKPKRPQTTESPDQLKETVDVEELPKKDYRFAMSKDYRTIVDLEHRSPDYEIPAYVGLPPSAASIAKVLISCANRKRNEGWCRPERTWRGAFQNGEAKRFKREQIEIKKHRDGLSYWRIIRTEEFHQHYNCKIKPRPKMF